MTKIGIIGGGQLGMMIAEAAKRLGAQTVALDVSEDAPAFRVCDEHVVARSFDDAEALERLCAAADVVTYEFENIPAQVLMPLAERYNIKQGVRQLLDSQDRLVEKRNAERGGLPCGGYMAVDNADDLRRGVERFGYPCVLKSRRLGYDGHGQKVLRSDDDLAAAGKMLDVPMILEEFIDFDYEASVIMVADKERIVTFPVGRNIHSGGILDLSVVPAPRMTTMVHERMIRQSEAFMRRCGYEGILAIEYFVRGGDVIFNEMAPRPHNSGHYTIEGCTTDQYTELVRYLLGEPLREPQLVAPTVMKNILGRDLEAAQTIAAEEHDGVHVHIYGKSESRPRRKMGHITMVGMTPERFDAEWAHRFAKDEQ